MSQRSDQQRKAIEVFCRQLAETLNLAGLEMRTVLKPSYKLWWTQESVKEHLFKGIMKAKYPKKESTTELEKHEIDPIHEELMRLLGEKFNVEYFPFPHDPVKDQDYKTEARKLEINYPS